MEEFIKKLEGMLQNLVELEVVTVVGDIPYPIDPAAPVKSAKVMRTRVNLIQGDILVEMAPDFATGDLKELRADHAARETQAAGIIKANVEALRSVFELLVDIRKQPPPASK